MMAPADTAEQLCDWTADFNGARAAEPDHRAFHFGHECPYRVAAEVLRGNPDPRRQEPR